MKHRDKLLWTFPRVAIIVLLLFYTINTAPAQTTLPAEDIAEKALAATVYLEMKDTNGKTLGIGSGFFVKPNLIATNYHVIEGAAKGTAKLVGTSTTYNIEGVTATEKTNDLALVKVIASGIKPLSLGGSDKVQAGETVYVTGNSKGLEGTFSNGMISRKRSENTKKRLRILRGSTRGMKGLAPIAVGSSIFPGSSGCPVLNKKGEVIGVFFMTLESGDILNFAIPSETLKKLMKQSKPVKPLSQEKQSISAETYLLWGNVKYDLGNYAGAIKDYTAAIQLKPDFVNAYINRGYANGRLQYPGATIADYIADVDTAIRLNPDNAYTYYNRGLMKGRFGQYADEIADYDTAIRLKPDYADAYLSRGDAKVSLEQHKAWMKVELGYYAAAIADYDEAIQLNPDDAYAYHKRGYTNVMLGHYAAAISDFDIAIRFNPDYTYSYYFRGHAKAWLGQYAAAIADYDEAIQIEPDAVYAYYSRGNTKSRLGQHAAAIADYDTVIRLKPDAADGYYNRGLAKAQLGQHTAAISDYDIAIRLKPDYVEAYYVRGLSKAQLGRSLEAKQDCLTALRFAIKAGDVDAKTKTENALRILNE